VQWGFVDNSVFDAFERLIHSAQQTDRIAAIVVLLGGEAGLRCGEMMALEWGDVDLDKRQLCVARSDWKDHVTDTKGGRARYVPLTTRLATALSQGRHLRSKRVLSDSKGQPLTQKEVQVIVRRVARRANVKPGAHILRHTFCSHLAIRGAPARAIQELAGHQDLMTTQGRRHNSGRCNRSRISNGSLATELREACAARRVSITQFLRQNNERRKKIGCVIWQTS
jgi:integrase